MLRRGWPMLCVRMTERERKCAPPIFGGGGGKRMYWFAASDAAEKIRCPLQAAQWEACGFFLRLSNGQSWFQNAHLSLSLTLLKKIKIRVRTGCSALKLGLQWSWDNEGFAAYSVVNIRLFSSYVQVFQRGKLPLQTSLSEEFCPHLAMLPF